jgi:hypothetical protein
LFLGISTLLLLELCFRFQVIEFYKSELDGLNPSSEIVSEKENILVFGDSFSAHPNSYVQFLRDEIPEYNFINSAIPGTGIKEHKLIVQKRIRQFKPKHIIYQFYVGNDLTDISHPVNFKTLSVFRNFYWLLSERILVVQYINYRLARLKPNKQSLEEIHKDEFSVDSYNKRVCTYIKGDPEFLSNTITLQGHERTLFHQWKNVFSDFLACIPDSVGMTIIVIPDGVQVSELYVERMRLLGAKFSAGINTVNYPLVTEIQKEFPELLIINPLEEFQNDEKNGKQLFYNNDPHMTFYGHKLLGKIILDQTSFTNGK